MVGWLLIAIFVLLPFVRVGAAPAVLLDLRHRQFTFFGKTFLPTDTVLLAVLLLGVVVAMFLLTAVLGRVWCGWACPQTVYLEFVYRPIERFFEGPPGRGGSIGHKASALRSAAKYSVYLVISILLANVFLAYFVGVESLARWMTRSPLEHPTSFAITLFTTGLVFADFAWFREQTCIVACPYGRLQSVLLDPRSLIVSYDARRGEPRRTRRSPHGSFDVATRSAASAATAAAGQRLDPAAVAEAPNAHAAADALAPALAPENRSHDPVSATAAEGHCIDCGLCVETCPTGIDIRDGLRMECLGCAQCIDACDAVMQKLKRPRGLIGYGSQARRAGEASGFWRPRLLAYLAVMLLITGVFVTLLLRSKATELAVSRGMGAPFGQLASGEIANPVRIKLTNRSHETQRYRVELEGAKARLVAPAAAMSLAPTASLTRDLVIAAAPEAFVRGKLKVQVVVYDDSNRSSRVTHELLGPFRHSTSAREVPAHANQ